MEVMYKRLVTIVYHVTISWPAINTDKIFCGRGGTIESVFPVNIMTKSLKKFKKPTKFNKDFKNWSINIHGAEKNDGSKIYSIAKELAKANIAFCCLREVRWRNVLILARSINFTGPDTRKREKQVLEY